MQFLDGWDRKPRAGRDGREDGWQGVHGIRWQCDGGNHVFVDGRKRKPRSAEADQDALYEEIGRLKVELDWLKKKAGLLEE